jgi:hypothetical protein
MRNLSSLFFILTISFLLLSDTVSAQKLKAEEIIAKHLDSIGTKENRDAVKNRFAIGLSEFESKLPSLKAAGKAILVSDVNNLFFVASFNSKEYPFEKIGIFAEKVNLPFVTAGARSPLGAFIADHSKILTDGLFAGSISSTWQLLSPEIKMEKFKLGGTKKIDGRKAYALDYFASGTSSDFSIRVFFDIETFQHLRTEYIRTIPPKQATFGVLGTQTGVKLELTESFGDFKKVGDLTLPHSYKLQYLSNSNSGVYEFNWRITISEFRINQKLQEGFFNFDDK